MTDQMTGEQKATSLNGTLSMGINWKWAHFTDELDAYEFAKWLDQHGYDNRGVYQPTDNDPTWGVRFR